MRSHLDKKTVVYSSGIYDQRRYSAKRRAAAAAAGMPLGGSDDDMGVGGESGSEEGGAEYVVACACGVTYDDGAAMIECERCKVRCFE